MTYGIVLFSGCIVFGIIGVLVIGRRGVRKRVVQNPGPGATQVQEPELDEDASRRLRLTAYQLRSIGMTLHGVASEMASTDTPQTARIAQAADDAFELAEDLHEYTMRSNTRHVIHDERLHLVSAIDEALRDLDVALRPGQREWLVAPDMSPIHLMADRRALRFILRDTLSIAVRSTGNSDPIAVTFDRDQSDFILQVEFAERPWVPVASRPIGGEDESRGALRLTLVRQLVQAHGGRVETSAVGAAQTAIRIHFPSARVIGVMAQAAAVP
jgi:signal transduction histidine kinase